MTDKRSDPLKHDSIYKSLFSNPEMVRELIQNFVPEKFVRDFDFSALTLCTGEHIGPELEKRREDLIWRARFKNRACYIFILLEFQSRQDPWMALRILTYTALLWEALIRRGEIKPGQKLPPVFPIVLYNGKPEWRRAVNVRDLIEPVPECLKTFQPGQTYFILDENRIPKDILENNESLTGFFLKFECARANEILKVYREFERRKKLFAEEPWRTLVKLILFWLNSRLEHQGVDTKNLQLSWESNDMLEENLADWREEIFQEGESLGLEKGRIEGIKNQHCMLLEMLTDRFESVPTGWEAMITAIDDPLLLRRLARSVWTVSGLREFEERLLEAGI